MQHPQAAAVAHAPAADAGVASRQVARESLRAPPALATGEPATRQVEAPSSRGTSRTGTPLAYLVSGQAGLNAAT